MNKFGAYLGSRARYVLASLFKGKGPETGEGFEWLSSNLLAKGYLRPLIVAPARLKEAGLLEPFLMSLRGAGLGHVLFLLEPDDIPDFSKAISLKRAYEEGNCDSLVGILSLPCLDLLKAGGALLADPAASPLAMLGHNRIKRRPPYMAFVASSPLLGGECDPVAYLEVAGRSTFMASSNLVPRALAHEFSLTPYEREKRAALSVATLALTVETALGLGGGKTKREALEAVSLAFRAVKPYVIDFSDLTAGKNMERASCLLGSSSILGRGGYAAYLSSFLADDLSSYARLLSRLVPEFIKEEGKRSPLKINRLYTAAGLRKEGKAVNEANELALALRSLCLGLLGEKEEVSFTKERLAEVAKKAEGESKRLNVPHPLKKEELLSILSKALN